MAFLAGLTHEARRHLMLDPRGEQILAQFPGPVTVKDPFMGRSQGLRELSMPASLRVATP
jgi:hypothetical protein